MQDPGIFYIFNLRSGYHSENSIRDMLWLFYLVMPFQSYQCLVFRFCCYRSSLFMLSVINVFFIFNILVYSQSDGKYAARLRIILQTPRQPQLCATQEFYIISMDFITKGFCGFLWISAALSQSPKVILLIISSSQLASYYSE